MPARLSLRLVIFSLFGMTLFGRVRVSGAVSEELRSVRGQGDFSAVKAPWEKGLKWVFATLFSACILFTPKSAYAQTTTEPVLHQGFAILDAQGRNVVEPVFRPGEKNILVVHGFNSTPASMRGIIDFALDQCANALVYKYPSGLNIAVSGRRMYQDLSQRLKAEGQPDTRFDIVAYSQGGLVARVAKEPGDINRGQAFGDQVENLVTIATPHTGIFSPISDLAIRLGLRVDPATVPGAKDQFPDSEFLRKLNSNPMQGATQYFAIAGRAYTSGHPFDFTDGLVHVDSAVGGGKLHLARGDNILRLKHSDRIPLPGVDPFPNHPDVYAKIKEWIFDAAPPMPVGCSYIAGVWNVSEEGREECTINGQPESPEGISGTAVVTIRQDQGSCTFSYDVTDLRVPSLRIPRNGVLAGRDVTITGPAAVAVPGSGAIFTENLYSARGTVCGGKISAAGSGKFSFTQNGVRVSCVTTSTAKFTRLRGEISNNAVSVSGASFTGNLLSSEAIVAVFGQGLATATQVATTIPLPTSLAGTSVRVTDSAGADRNAPLFYVSPNQINYLMPSGTANGLARITIVSGTREVASGAIEIQIVHPALFSANATGEGVAAATIERIRADGSRSSELAFRFDQQLRRYVPLPINLGPASDQLFLVLYGTGIRGVQALSAVSVTVAGEKVPVLYAGAQPSFVGLDQVNAGPLPRALMARGEVAVVLEANGRIANVVTLAFQ
jgi:uncharacterized protein (TIGR03437 family)